MNQTLTPRNPICPDCGFSHPPVVGGCPLKKEKSSDGKDLNWLELLDPLKLALTAKAKMKQMTFDESKKMTQQAIITAVKWVEENYK